MNDTRLRRLHRCRQPRHAGGIHISRKIQGFLALRISRDGFHQSLDVIANLIIADSWRGARCNEIGVLKQGMTLDLPDCGNEVFPSFAERHLLSPSSDGDSYSTARIIVKQELWLDKKIFSTTKNPPESAGYGQSRSGDGRA